jgi:hypothetical protein
MSLQALVALTVVYLGHNLTRPYCVYQTLVVFASSKLQGRTMSVARPVRSTPLHRPARCQSDSLDRRNDHLIIMLGRLCLDRTVDNFEPRIHSALSSCRKDHGWSRLWQSTASIFILLDSPDPATSQIY